MQFGEFAEIIRRKIKFLPFFNFPTLLSSFVPNVAAIFFFYEKVMMNGSRGNFILIVIFIILITHPFHALCQKHSRKDTLSEFSLPSCGVAATKSLKKRYRVAFISHDSAIATFFHNPEQGSRDAANMIDVDIEWNHYLGVSVPKMVKDIHDAVDKVARINKKTLKLLLKYVFFRVLMELLYLYLVRKCLMRFNMH